MAKKEPRTWHLRGGGAILAPVGELDVVRMAYVAFGRRRVDDADVRALASPGFQFHMRPGWPGRELYTLNEMPQMWADLDATFTEYRLEPVGMRRPAPGWVLVDVDTSTRVHDGSRIAERIIHLWRLEDGLLAEGWALGDEASVHALISRLSEPA